MIIRLPSVLRRLQKHPVGGVVVDWSAVHFQPDLRPTHGPQVWPWWLPCSFALVRLCMQAPSTGYRLWFYTRWGACYGEVFFDRRPRPLG